MSENAPPQGDEGQGGRHLPDLYRGGGLPRRRASDLLPAVGGGVTSDRLDFSGIIAIFRRRLVLFLVILALCIQLAYVVTIMTPERYTASADVVLRPKVDAITPGNPAAADEQRRAEDIETQVAVLRSRSLAGLVFDRLNLAADADFVSGLRGGGVLSVKEAAVNALIAALDVRRAGNAYVLRISFSNGSAERAARIANGYARLFSQAQIEAEASENRTAIAVLRSRMEQLRAQAQDDFQALQTYRIRNNLQTPSGTSLTEQEISAYNQQAAAARAQAAEARARSVGNGAAASAGSAAVNALRSQRAVISTRLAELSSRYVDTHPEVAAARQQLSDLDRQIDAEVARARASLATEARASGEKYSSLAGSLSRATGTLAANNAALVTMGDLTRRADASRQLYESYLGRYKEAVARAGAEQPRSSVLSAAQVPTSTSSPNRLLNLLLGLLVGTLLGGGAAIIAESGFGGLTTGEDVEKRLGLRFLGAMPLSGSLKPHAETPAATLAQYPGGMLAESVRGLLTSVRQGRGEARLQVLAITSALPGEGKTTISVALAQVARMGGQRVAIVDSDVVRCSLSETHGPSRSQPGLREMFAGEASLEAVAVPILDGVTLFPITTRFETGERLVRDGRLHALIARLREHFDLVILDCAPVLPIAETREIVSLADSVIMVTRWRSTSERAIRAAVKMLPAHAIQQTGVVLNQVDMRKRVRFGGSDADVFHRSYQDYYRG